MLALKGGWFDTCLYVSSFLFILFLKEYVVYVHMQPLCRVIRISLVQPHLELVETRIEALLWDC
jgi:hypothetical protein